MKCAAGWCLVLLIYQSVQAQTPDLVLPVGHTSSVTAASFSADGKFIVTASWDNTAKVWLAPEGRLLLDLKGHNASLTSARYSNSGTLIVTTSKDSTARLWRAADGKLMHELKGHKDWVGQALFTSDDRYAITASWDGMILKWDTRTGRMVNAMKGHRGAVASLALSGDGKKLVSASKDSTLIIWNLTRGSVIRTLRGHHDWVNSAVFSSKGDVVLSASADGTCRTWDASTGKTLLVYRAHEGGVNTAAFNAHGSRMVSASNDGSAIIWETSSGKPLVKLIEHKGAVTAARYIKNTIATAGGDNNCILWDSSGRKMAVLAGHGAGINNIAVDAQDNMLVTSSADNTAALWDVNEGTLICRLIGHTSVVTSAAYSRDGKYLVTASWDSTAKIWSATDGKLLSNLKGHTHWINSAAFSSDGKMVVTASMDNTARIWSVPEGTLLRELKGHQDWVGSAIFSADGRYVVTTSWDNTSIVFDVSTGKIKSELKGHDDVVKWVNFSHDLSLIVTSSADHTARIWEAESGRMIQVLRGHSDNVRTAEFSDDDKYVVTASWDSTAIIWSAATGKPVRILKGHSGPLNNALISPDGKYITTSSMDNTARIWDFATGTLLHELRGHQKAIHSAHYSRDGKFIVLASWDNTATIWNAITGRKLHSLSGHTAPLKSATFSPDGMFVITTSEDNTLKQWEVKTGKFLYTFFAVDSLDYLAIDSDGHYDGTASARRKLYYTCGNEIVDLEQFKDLSWEPNLVSKLTGRNQEPVTAKKISEINLCNYTPVVIRKEKTAQTYHYEIIPRMGGIGEIQLFVNGKLIRIYSPLQLPRKNGNIQLQISNDSIGEYLSSVNDNLLVVKATTREGLMTSRGAPFTVPGLGRPVSNPDMYMISIGISDYKGKQLRLKYASKDAIDFSSAITSSAEKLLNGDGKKHVFTYEITTEENSARWPLKQRIAALIDSVALMASPDDIIMIFFAGHGVLQAGQKTFYLLTADASNTELSGVEKDVAVSTEELREWLRKIKANKQLLILDACNSGQVVKQFQGFVDRRDVPADQQRALENLRDKTGTYILCASASGQAAYETSLYSQGLLTYSLLAGLKFGNGLRQNKFVDVNRWFNYACDNVKKMASEIGGRQDPQILGNASFEIGIVDKEVIDRIRLSGKKLPFKNSTIIQDYELLNDDLGISYMVDRELNDVSSSVKGSPWVFVSDNPNLEAYTIRGKYDVNGENLVMKMSIFRGQKERIHQFELQGTVAKKDILVRKIIDVTKTYMNQLAKSSL